MKLMLWVNDEGPTDLDLKDGDIWAVYPDSWIPGVEELKKWLVVQMAEYGGSQNELTASDYVIGGSLEPQIRRMRKYRIDYRPRLTPDELQAVINPDISVPVMENRFVICDILRK